MAIGKRTLYVMLPVNICLWSYIGYLIYQGTGDSEVIRSTEAAVSILKINDDTSTYKLVLNYPDPFLKEESNYRTKQNNSDSPQAKDSKPKHSKNTVPIPSVPVKDIRYLGLIQNKTSGVTTALITVNGKSFIVKKGEVVEGINFVSITDGIIIAKIGKEKMSIIKT
jgi:Tfp pilus assembly protein PilP